MYGRSMMAGRKPRLTEADHDAWAGFTRHVGPLTRRTPPSSGSLTGSTTAKGGETAKASVTAKADESAKAGAPANRSALASNGPLTAGRAPTPIKSDQPPRDMTSPPAWRPAQPRAEAAARPGTGGTALAVGGPPAGVDKATWQRFRTGKLAPSRKLDLHGMTAQRAFQALTGFLRGAHADGLRCVEIVNGRGNPLGSANGTGAGEGTGVIRREFPLWLNRPDIRPLVLGATHPQVVNPAHPHTADRNRPHAANTGAVRLLLRRVR
jgi:DNA-nicking Smr family endonuclease